MIGFDATNSLGQGLAAREKIFSFTLSYFAFINDSIPSFSFVINSENKQDILSFVSGKITEYFENFVIQTEGEKNEDGTLINPKDRSPLAKYYLAAIYYYEPSFDFSSTGISDIYKLGETYLLEMFSENLSLLLDKSKKYTNIRIPSFPSATNQDLWKYFTYAMLATEYNSQYVNIIQQPVSLASRTGNSLLDYIESYFTGLDKEKKFLKYFLDEKFTKPFYATHENKRIEAKLADLNFSKYNLQQVYISMNWYIVNSWKNFVEKIIDHSDEPVSVLPDNSKEFRSVSLLKDMIKYVEAVNPESPKTNKEIQDLYNNLINSINVAYSEYDKKFILGHLDAINDNDYSKNLNKEGGKLYPYDGNFTDLIFPSGYEFLDTKQYVKSLIDNYSVESSVYIKILDLIEYYKNMIIGFNNTFVKQINYEIQNLDWKDSPNVIESFIKAEGINLTFEQFVKSVLKDSQENYTPETFKLIVFPAWKALYADYQKNPQEYVVISDSYINTNTYLPGAAYLTTYAKNLFVTYFSNGHAAVGKTIEYPQPLEIELSTFFEFSFQPNFFRIKEKFPDKITNEKIPSFELLKGEYFLNFSKTETYIFLKNLLGQQLVETLTTQEFNSLFDLCVSIQHKVPYKYFDKNNFLSIANLKKSIKALSSYFKNSKYSFRRWINLSDDKFSSNLILFNPLTDESKNNATIPIQSLQTNACINLGSVTNFNINIPTFNPVNTFRDDELAYKFIDMIDNTPIGDYLKNNYNYMPYDFSVVAKNLLANKASSLPENFIINNDGLFVNSHSLLSKNLLENLITTIEQLKEQ